MILNKSKYKNIIISMDIVKITSERLGKFVLLNILKNKDFKNHALGYVNGTTVLHLSKKAIPKYKIALPNNEHLLNKLDNILESQYLKIVSNTI